MHCSTASQLLPITEPDVEGDLAVSRTFTSSTGRMVDCSASGACVLGTYRFEEDGSSTFAGSPVSFAP